MTTIIRADSWVRDSNVETAFAQICKNDPKFENFTEFKEIGDILVGNERYTAPRSMLAHPVTSKSRGTLYVTPIRDSNKHVEKLVGEVTLKNLPLELTHVDLVKLAFDAIEELLEESGKLTNEISLGHAGIDINEPVELILGKVVAFSVEGQESEEVGDWMVTSYGRKPVVMENVTLDQIVNEAHGMFAADADKGISKNILPAFGKNEVVDIRRIPRESTRIVQSIESVTFNYSARTYSRTEPADGFVFFAEMP